MRKLDVAIESWEDKVGKLLIEFGESLTNRAQLAALFGMLPSELQERALDKCSGQWDGVQESDTARIVAALKMEMKGVAKARDENRAHQRQWMWTPSMQKQ